MAQQEFVPKESSQANGRTVVTNWLLGLLSIICVGSFSFLWHMSEDMAIMKDHDVQKQVLIERIQGDVNQLRTEVENVNTNNALLKNTVDEIKANQTKK